MDYSIKIELKKKEFITLAVISLNSNVQKNSKYIQQDCRETIDNIITYPETSDQIK